MTEVIILPHVVEGAITPAALRSLSALLYISYTLPKYPTVFLYFVLFNAFNLASRSGSIFLFFTSHLPNWLYAERSAPESEILYLLCL